MYQTTTDEERTDARLVRLTKVWLKGPVRAKEEAFHALMNFGHPKALSVVREVVAHRSSLLRDYAVDYNYAAGQTKNEESAAILALGDAKWTNRCAAIHMLKRTRTSASKRALLARYKVEKHPIVRRDISCCLGYWNDRKIVDFLSNALVKEKHVFGRIGCLEGLVRCGERSNLEAYLALLNHEDSLVRQQVVNSICHNNFHPEDRSLVRMRLNNMLESEEQPAVRTAIQAALSKLIDS